MWGGIISYFASWLVKHLQRQMALTWILIKAVRAKAMSRDVIFRCYGQHAYLHILSSQKNDFELFVLAIEINKMVGNKIGFVIKIDRVNFCYLEEVLNFCLGAIGAKLMNVKRPDADEAKSLFERYEGLVAGLNKELLPLKVSFIFDDKDRPVLKRVLDSFENIGKKSPEFVNDLSAVFHLLDAIKEQRHSAPTTNRYFSLLSEELILGPRQVVLDLYHKCNTDCVHCWIHSPTARKVLTKEFASQMMDYDVVKKIIDDCFSLGVDTITLLGDGEPILHPDFVRIVKYIKKKNPYMDALTFSNGLALTPRVSQELVKSGLNEIWFSVPAASPEVYQKICPSKKARDFERIKKNIHYLCRLKNKVRDLVQKFDLSEKNAIIARGARVKTFPMHCVITFVLHNLNYHEILDMANMAVELGVDEMRFQLIHLDRDNKWLQLDQAQVDFLNSKLQEVRAVAEKGRVMLGLALEFQLSHMHAPTGDWSRGYYLQHGCPIGFFFSIIKANGDVGLCCSLKVVDNVHNKSFKEIWLSQRYHQARVGAKHLRDNKDQLFQSTTYHKNEARGDYLYSERCELCDNHDMNNEVIQCLSRIKLADPFMK
ncbi:MAG: radical SAM protein [Candidatus Omnitrophota bacterium]